MAGSEEISLDCNELRRLASLTTRESVRCLLAKHIQELEEKLKVTSETSTAEKEKEGEELEEKLKGTPESPTAEKEKEEKKEEKEEEELEEELIVTSETSTAEKEKEKEKEEKEEEELEKLKGTPETSTAEMEEEEEEEEELEKLKVTPESTAEKEEKEKEKEEDSASGKEPIPTPKPTDSPKILLSQLATKTITSYGWDQSPKFVKVYVTLDGVHNLAKGDVTVEYTPWSFTMQVKKTDCIHQLTINSLLEELIPDKSRHKVKTDNLVIFLKKSSERNWDYLTKTEKKAKQKKSPPKPENAGDPSAGIMNLMKQMYDDGDDEMKRTIAKAWTEARDKKDTMDLP